MAGLLTRAMMPTRMLASTGRPDAWDDAWYPGGWNSVLSAAGIRVSPDLALTLSGVWAAVTLISGDIGAMPCHINKRLPDDGKQRWKQHPLHYVLRYRPNRWQTAKQYWEMQVGHILLRGNAYTRIVAGPRGFADQLVPLHPDRVRVERYPSGQLAYQVTQSRGPILTLSEDDVMHFHSMTQDGLIGLSAVEYGANSFGAALATERHAGQFFKTGATASIALVHPQTFGGPEALANFQKSTQMFLSDQSNVGGLLTLEEGMGVHQLSVSPEKAQLLSTREFSLEDIARWMLNIPPHKIGAKTSLPYASREEANEEYAQRLIPLIVEMEQVILRDLILQDEVYYAEFVMEGLLRGNAAARASYYHAGINDGWLVRNEARAKEGLNRIDGLDTPLEPQNMRGANGPMREADGEAESGRLAGQSATAAAFNFKAYQLADGIAKWIVREEKGEVAKAASRYARDAAGWASWLKTYYKEHAGHVSAKLKMPLPVAQAYAAEHREQLQNVGVSVTERWDVEAVQALALAALGQTEEAR